MTQISGSWSAEVDLTRLAEEIAQRTAVLVVSMLQARPAGSDVYEREPGPDPGAGTRRGHTRFGAVTDTGTEYDQPPRETR